MTLDASACAVQSSSASSANPLPARRVQDAYGGGGGGFYVSESSTNVTVQMGGSSSVANNTVKVRLRSDTVIWNACGLEHKA